MKKVYFVILLLLLSPVLLLLYVVGVIFAIGVFAYSRLWLIWFRWKHAGHVKGHGKRSAAIRAEAQIVLEHALGDLVP